MKGVPEQPLPPRFIPEQPGNGGAVTSSLAEVFLHHVTQQPQAPFLTDPATATSLTYAETAQRAAALAHSLRRAGVQPGDRVALLVENSWHWPVAFLAAGLAGAIVVPFNTRWSATEIQHALRDCGPAVVLHDDASAGAIGVSATGAVRPAPRLSAADFPVDGPQTADLPDPASIGAITYTSGTSGLAKGVMLTHDAMHRASLTYAALFNSGPRLRTAVVVPLFHNTGFIDGLGHALVAGGHLDVYRRFDARLIAARLGAGEYSYLIGVPTMYTRMLPHLQRGDGTAGPGPWLAYGGAAMPPATVRRLHELIPGARLVNCYGLSEATSITHYLPHDLAADRPDAVGMATPGTLDRISESGELEVSSPTVMAGYWNDPAATAARLDGGWLRTGDCARRSADGLITITGRTSDLINRGGEKIAPYEVESALCDISGIIEAVVVGLPHHDLGEIPVALVVCAAGTTVTQPEVRRRLRDRLADYKIPEQVLAVPALPRNASGKVVRMEALKLARRLG
jgi:long-chain acyl-CoA synthetase